MTRSRSKGPEIVTLGECMAVLFPERAMALDRARTVRVDIAGTEANTAIGLARLGVRARFVSRVGNDPLGRRISTTLEREGVDVSFLATDERAQTGVFFREPLADGARRVFYYRAESAASCMSPDHISREMFAGARFVHLSGITAALSPSCEATVRRAIDLAHECDAKVSFDPNYRAKLWDAATARATLTGLTRSVDLLLLSEDDAALLFPEARASDVLEKSTTLGPGTVVFKRAERGASAIVGGKRFSVPARRVRRLVDTVGAGDGFNAGFLAGMVRGWDPQRSLELGAEIGARAVERLGDYAGYPKRTIRNEREGKRKGR
jgi:2-dehydro-3-deoxygluconokinase